MNKSFDQYMIRVREQLDCNATEQEKYENGTYPYSNEDIDKNISYFEKCYNDNLSEYKALELFFFYLNENDIVEKYIKPIFCFIYGIISLFVIGSLVVALMFDGSWKFFFHVSLIFVLYHLIVGKWCFKNILSYKLKYNNKYEGLGFDPSDFNC
jgi:hypothetical protein